MSIVYDGTTFNNGGNATAAGTSLTEIRADGTTVWKKETPQSSMGVRASGAVSNSGSLSASSSGSWDLRGSSSVVVNLYYDYVDVGARPMQVYTVASQTFYWELLFADGTTAQITSWSGNNLDGKPDRSTTPYTKTIDISNKSESAKAEVRLRERVNYSFYRSDSSSAQPDLTGAYWEFNSWITGTAK